MKKFLSAAFHITWFQLLLVLSLSGLKYWISSYALGQRLQLPLVFIGMGAFLLLLIALGIGGYLENKGYAVDNWVAARPNSRIRIWIARFTHWGQVLPIALGYSFFLYMIMPTSMTLFIVFFAGIVLRNIIEYLLLSNKSINKHLYFYSALVQGWTKNEYRHIANASTLAVTLNWHPNLKKRLS